jgi:Cyd operon protein YbgE (Cyd_oper_YbgE)
MNLARPDGSGARHAIALGRAASLAVAGLASLALTLDPCLLNGVSATRIHAGLPLLMLGVSGAFACGLGFQPSGRISRALVQPALAWALLGAGTSLIVLR